MTVFQQRVSEEAVDEDQDNCGERKVVQLAPERTADAIAQQGRDEKDKQQVDCDGAGEIDERLQRGMDGPQKIDDAEAWSLLKQQDDGVRDHQNDRDVGGPLMQREDVDAAAGPASCGAVAKCDQQAEQQVDGRRAGRAETEVRGDIQGGDRVQAAPFARAFIVTRR